LGQKAAIYARVSTSDQSCDRQISELTAFALRGDYDVVSIFKETASGTSANRSARNRLIDLAQARKIDAILVTELSRWGRSTQDLLDTMNKLAGLAGPKLHIWAFIRTMREQITRLNSAGTSRRFRLAS
jgi:DNA invertase Pin-like site-specific DNA recombinase